MQPTPPSSTATSAGASRQASSSARVKVKHVQHTLRTESTIAILNPTPSATPPPALLRRGTQAAPSTTSRSKASSSRAQQPVREAIDVDELYERKYAVKEEDVVEAIDVGAFRQSVREKGLPREKERERYREWEATVPQAAAGVGMVAATATAAVRAPSTSTSTSGPLRSLQGADAGTVQQQYEHPSIIAEALNNMKAKQKRAAAALQRATELPGNKRRRTDDASPMVSPSKRAQGRQAVAIANNQQEGGVLSTPRASTSSAQGTPRAASLKRKHSPKSHFPERGEVIVISDSGDEVEAVLMSKRAKSSSKARQVSATRGTQMQEQETRSTAPTLHPVSPAKRQHEVIELFSSSDVEVMEIDSSPPKKKTKPTPSSSRQLYVDIDDYSLFDEGPTGYHAPETPDLESSESESEGWDLNDPDRWVPMPENKDSHDTSLTDALHKLDVREPPERVPPPICYIPPNTSMNNPFLRVAGYTQGPPCFIWDKLAMAANTVVSRRPRPFPYLSPSRVYIPPRDQDFGLHRLRRAFHDPSKYDVLRRAPGCISKIEQKGPLTVIASGSIGGLPDVPDETPDADNGPGSLMIWDGKLHIPSGHHAAKENPTYVKYYAVHDVAFHPTRQGFVSCGADRQVIYWEEKEVNTADNDIASDSGTGWTGTKLFQGSGLPYELAFKPDSLVLAIGERKLHLWVVVGPERKFNRERASFCVQKSNEPHHIGSIGWGSSSTTNHLFASSEPDNEGDFTGIHKAYDVSRRSLLYTFDATEAGDMLCIRPDGESLALSTRGEGNKPMLRLYDIKRKNNTATTTIVLDPYDALYPNFEGEVNCSTFSPDGILLALARNDNQTHVYDVRFMANGRPPLFAFRHTGKCRSASSTIRYGVVKAQWLQSARSRRLALVTGGDDGCVRSWDPQIAADDPKNGHVVAEALSDIGHFSIGDPFNGEHRMVVGDCNGEIYFFDSII